ncbi:adenylyl-sulfate kinase [Aeromonas veronii]|uniref:adenylyl-sulfate kinase n=1 Tax=Aeromonas veronii TaxID=654 RepID=UPI0011177364|nr:adenylyl-sulfate kinase [Aeromonas veronii]
MVIWLCGLSGVGKSTIASALFERLKIIKPDTVLVDGDCIRALFEHQNENKDYSLSARRVSAQRMQNICQWLDAQNILVVAASIAMFDDINQANRGIFSQYVEVHIHADIKTLVERDNKGLYQSALRGERRDVLGVDIPYLPPSSADLRIENSFNPADVDEYVNRILTLIGIGSI